MLTWHADCAGDNTGNSLILGTIKPCNGKIHNNLEENDKGETELLTYMN